LCAGEHVGLTLPMCGSSAKLGSVWDAAVTTSGASSTAKDRGYNASIPAGGSHLVEKLKEERGMPRAKDSLRQ